MLCMTGLVFVTTGQDDYIHMQALLINFMFALIHEN